MFLFLVTLSLVFDCVLIASFHEVQHIRPCCLPCASISLGGCNRVCTSFYKLAHGIAWWIYLCMCYCFFYRALKFLHMSPYLPAYAPFMDSFQDILLFNPNKKRWNETIERWMNVKNDFGKYIQVSV